MTDEVVLEAPDGSFDPGEVAALDEPVRRFFGAAIAPGTPRWRSVHLVMRGSIRVGRWLPFRATQTLTPRRGFLFRARAAGVITGSDRYHRGAGAMHWKLFGLVPVMDSDGEDVTRSAAGRAGGEALWVPTALLPHYGTTWEAIDDHHIRARFAVDDTPIDLRHTIDDDGHVTEFVVDRWGDPEGTGTFGWHLFGGSVADWRIFAGMTIPSVGSLGWGYGTDRWEEGEFFRYRLTSVVAVGPTEASRPVD